MGRDEADAQTSFNGSLNANLFEDQDVHKALESRVVMDQQGDAQDDQIVEDSTPELDTDSEDSASDKKGDKNAAAELEDGIVDDVIPPSPGEIRTRSKAWKVTIPAPVMCSDSQDDEDRPRPRKRTNASPAPLRTGGSSNCFGRNSNQFPSIASKKLAARQDRDGNRGQMDGVQGFQAAC